jgi:hypothetical protein
MSQNIKQLYGHKLRASDGDIGHVKDLYFDDQNWTVRYVVADTGSWMPGRQVLLSPHAFGSLHQDGKLLLVNLTRKQIEDSPSIEEHKTVSRQYEEEYHRYYGWPYYWEGTGIWGMSGFPFLQLPPKPAPEPCPAATCPQPVHSDAHLRSTQAVSGYNLRAGDEIIGHVCDFLMDPQSWAISQLVVKIGHRLTGEDVLIPVGKVSRISYDESTVFANMAGDIPRHSPAPHLISDTVMQ